MNIIQMRNSNAFPGRYGLKPRWVILHGTAGGTSAQAIAQYFQSTQGSNNPVSAHYAIGQDGQIVQCNAESDGAWANGVVTAGHDPWWSENDNPNPNNVTISIEHCKPDDANVTVLTAAQQASSFWLIKDICQRNNIPMRPADVSGGITGHYSIDPINRSRCPGNYDWKALWANGGTPPVATQPIQPTANQLRSANDSWDSVLKSTVAGPAPRGTGIYQAWLQSLLSGKFYGPPITREYDSVDWNGGHIVCQEFGHARCEWVAGSANWYGPSGKI